MIYCGTMPQFSTPMMQQYARIKNQYKDCLLFFRLGDFYELFLEDAHIGAEVLDITLTSRPKGRDGRIPMAGVPYHAVDSYLAKLVKAGYKVAICEQVSEPDKYGIVEREVIRVVTPGTVMDEKALERKENNYLISMVIDNDVFSITSADISTGHLKTMQVTSENLETTLADELTKINPSECILPPALYNDHTLLKFLKKQRGLNIYPYHNWVMSLTESTTFLKKHFGLKSLESFDIIDKPLSVITAANLISYLKETQKDHIGHIRKIVTTQSDDYVSLDRSTIVNLELFSTIREHATEGSLLSILDKTKTAMGGRMLKDWLKHPLKSKSKITARHDGIAELIEESKIRKTLEKSLSDINDIERVLSRLSVGIGNARDMLTLASSLKNVLLIKHKLVNTKTNFNQKIQLDISPRIRGVIQLIELHILDEPAISIKEGGIIKDGVDKKLDHLRDIVNNGKTFIIELEAKERKRSGINSLKVRFNKVFGFYIEVSKANAHLVPKDFIRKQTLVNAERFITPELKKHEEIILTSEEELKILEYELYQKILVELLTYTKIIQKASNAVSRLDCLLGFTEVSIKNKYNRPTLLFSNEIRIKNGRHPVVEKLLEDKQFVPNDVCLDQVKQQLLVITGPNMAGKSVFIRQVAIIVLMAQIGCFVPASSAHIGIVDKIFVRSGASDVITSGLSTFMVEMVETAYILNNATKNSLIIMDEIGRGTSTYDGISIAWAVAEYLVTNSKTPPKTLFATHYHELQDLERQYPKRIKNYHMSVSEDNGEPIFLHTLNAGGASHSFGVAVAKLAGVPDSVVTRAYEILHSLENQKTNEIRKDPKPSHPDKLSSKLNEVDINSLTPLEALNLLAELKSHGNH